jgi:subtilisin family serine protease
VDLVDNLWFNTGEIADNGIDDDDNGYIDDVDGYDFFNDTGAIVDVHGHGTHVAGIVSAQANQNAEIMPLRFTNDDSIGDTSKGLEAIDYAVDNGARVINLSWIPIGNNKSLHTLNLMEAIVDYSQDGIVFVIAAGNHGELLAAPEDSLEADVNKYAIIVGASDAKGFLADFSNYGADRVHLLAPGENILSTVPGDDYSTWSGTSQAAPAVAAAAASVLSVDPDLSATEVKDIILNSVNHNAELADVVASSGILNIQNAVALASGQDINATSSLDLDSNKNASSGAQSGGCSFLDISAQPHAGIVFSGMIAFFFAALFAGRLRKNY